MKNRIPVACTYWRESKCRNKADCSHTHFYNNLQLGEDIPSFYHKAKILNDESEQGVHDKALERISVLASMRFDDIIHTSSGIQKNNTILVELVSPMRKDGRKIAQEGK